MRLVLIPAALLALAAPASAEVWTAREGRCGEWQSRWEMRQEQDGVWVGHVDYVNVGGPCVRPTGEELRNDVRATISNDTLFIVRGEPGGQVCTHVARMGEQAARGFVLCEGNGARLAFAVRFRGQEDRSRPGAPADDQLLEEEDRPQSGRRFRERGLDDWFGRR